MRSVLSLAALLCCLVSASPASDRTENRCTEPGCADDGCAGGSCAGRAYVSLYEGKRLYEPIPLPQHPGPHRCVTKPETKEVKKTVYETKWVPYCLPNPTCARCRADDCERPCPACEKCVRWKKVVVKREIVVDRLCCYECVAEPCHVPRGATTEVPPTPAEPPTAPPASKP